MLEDFIREEKEDRTKEHDIAFNNFWRSYIKKQVRDFELSDFEKHYYLKWFKMLIKSNRFSVYEINSTIQLMCVEKVFKINVCSKYLGRNVEIDAENYDYYTLMDGIYKELNKVRLPKDTSLMKKKFTWIAELFDFSEITKDILIFTYLYRKSKPFEDLCYGSRGNIQLPLGAYYNLCVDSFVKRSDITLAEKLFNNNLIVELNNEGYSLSEYYINALEDETLTTKNRFIKHLIGSPQKSDLTIKDFDYISQLDLLKDILINASKTKKQGVNILLTGFSGTGKTSLAKVLASESNLACYAVATDKNDKEIKRAERLADLQAKSAVLKSIPNTCLLFDEAEDVFNRGFSENGTSSKGYLNRLLEGVSVPCIFTTNDSYNVDVAFMRRMSYILETPILSEEQRLKLWQRVTKKNNLKVSKNKLEELSKSYDVPPAIIANAVETTKLVNGGDEVFDEIIESVASVVTKKKEVKKKRDFDKKSYNIDIVNADVNMRCLTEMLLKANRLDFTVCLYGPSGCGKTQWAKALLDSMSLDYITCKASDILSKWVGGSEENLDNKFREATEKQCGLIIDEADTFIMEREMANNSWERSLSNEFLVQLENFKYPCLCTTNLMNIVDSAAYRRFLIKVGFKYMQSHHFKRAMKFFFNIDSDKFLKGVTPADFSVVKRELEFFGNASEDEIIKLLQREVDVKKDKNIKQGVGF